MAFGHLPCTKAPPAARTMRRYKPFLGDSPASLFSLVPSPPSSRSSGTARCSPRQHKRRKTVIILRRVVHDRADEQHVESTPSRVPARKSSASKLATRSNCGAYFTSAVRRQFTPSSLAPSISTPLVSIGAPSSVVRQCPTASKFSSENPIGSMILWQLAQGFLPLDAFLSAAGWWAAYPMHVRSKFA